MAPIVLAMVESFFPPLPLVAIVALNVAAHGGLLGFVYSWAGVAFGRYGYVFVFWRRIVKRFFWRVASRWDKLQKQSAGSAGSTPPPCLCCRCCRLPPPPCMHLAFRISDLDEKRYLITVMLGKGIMVGMMALFGQSLVSALKNPFYLILAVLLWGAMYCVRKYFCKKHNLE